MASGAAAAYSPDGSALCRKVNKTIQTSNITSRPAALRLGFVPLTDCAPLVMAKELGLFGKYGLRVVLSRELGWATIRDKVIHRELDAAHALAPMPFAATLGLGSVRCPCLTALVLNLHGNAITLSHPLWQRGVRDGASLREEVVRSRREKVLTFGVVSTHSSHHFLLRGWLAASGIDPDREVRIVVVPPPQMPANLKAGHLDGFCVGEPWNSVAVRARAGWCVAASAELDPGHPEKVLMVRREFAGQRHEEHLALVAALLEACRFCDAVENREAVVAVLARAVHLGVAPAALRPAFDGHFDFGHGRLREVSDFTVFNQPGANDPDGVKAAWIIKHLRASSAGRNIAGLDASLGRQVFRHDLFDQAERFQSSTRNLLLHENTSELQPAPA